MAKKVQWDDGKVKKSEDRMQLNLCTKLSKNT